MRSRKHHPGPSGVVPGYTHLAEIGGSFFSTVYRATELETGRSVALKVLRADAVHPHLRETFDDEIRALAKVSDHPNIVTLYRPLSTPDGRPVLVLELCRESIAEQTQRLGPLDPADVVRVAIKIAGALETAHRRGFLHRDMKPQNILVTQFWEPALADFGVAALQASIQAISGEFGLTTLHVAPEILEGDPLSPATDVYGLASTMYQLLSGLAPFATFDNEAPASVILRIIRDPVRPLRMASVPIALSDALEAALAKAPENRPHSALEFAQTLQEIEARAGWPQTAYTVWEESSPPSPPPRAIPSDLVSPPPASAEPAWPLRIERPMTTTTDARSPLPPLLPPPPPPVLSPRGPSTTGPADPPVRQVVPPDLTSRGQARQPLSERTDPLPPLLPPSGAGVDPGGPAGEQRPVFADPEPLLPAPLPYPPGPGERSISNDRRAGTVHLAGDGQPPPAPSRPSPASFPLVIAGMAAAATVVVVALLLVFHAI